MNHDELVEKMHNAYCAAGGIIRPATPYGKECMAAALRVCVEELLRPTTPKELSHRDWLKDRTYVIDAILANRSSRYQKPKSDPAVEAVEELMVKNPNAFGWLITANAAEIIAAVRKADNKDKSSA